MLTLKQWRLNKQARSRNTTNNIDTTRFPDGFDINGYILHSFGIAGEAGEIADETKKVLFHDKPLNPEKYLDEIGDVLWYCDSLLAKFGYTVEDCIAYTDIKLEKRYPSDKSGWGGAQKHYDHTV